MKEEISCLLTIILFLLTGCEITNDDVRKIAFTGAGWNPVITLDINGNPHIVYADNTTLSFKYAFKDGDGWHTETIEVLYSGESRQETLYFVPNIPTIATIEVDSSLKTHVIYYNPYKRTIEYRKRDVNGWAWDRIDSVENYGGYAGDTLVDGKGGFYISNLSIDSNGIPWILYEYDPDADFYIPFPREMAERCPSGGILAVLKAGNNLWSRYNITINGSSSPTFALVDDVPAIFYIQDGGVKYGEWNNGMLIEKGVLYKGYVNAYCAYMLGKLEPFLVIKTEPISIDSYEYVFGKKINGVWNFESKTLPDRIVGDFERDRIVNIDGYNNTYYFSAEFYPKDYDFVRDTCGLYCSNRYLGVIKNEQNNWDYIWIDKQPYGNFGSMAIDTSGNLHLVYYFVEEINYPRNRPYEFHARLYYGLYNRERWEIELVDE